MTRQNNVWRSTDGCNQFTATVLLFEEGDEGFVISQILRARHTARHHNRIPVFCDTLTDELICDQADTS